jgi:hypothetical protein
MEIIQIVIPLLVIGLAFWRRDIFLYIMATAAAVELGLTWYIEYRTPEAMTIAIVLGGIGAYAFALAIENLLDKIRK